eukprot:scaffold5219_cov45-Prasinocladus_malaysianus.AAC.1
MKPVELHFVCNARDSMRMAGRSVRSARASVCILGVVVACWLCQPGAVEGQSQQPSIFNLAVGLDNITAQINGEDATVPLENVLAL